MQFGLAWPFSLSSYWRSFRRVNSIPSSTSSSKPALVYAKILAGTCAILLIAVEIYSAYMVKRYSVTYARVSRQYAEALKVRPAASGGPISVLMVGNSLLLDGVDVNRLQERTSGTLQIYPIFLEGTGYYDWFYGLSRLFRQGAKPQVVVVGLEVNTFIQNGVWEESPMMLFDAGDVLNVASELGLDHTATSNLLLSHLSTFWEMRSFFRRRVLSLIVPHFESLFPYIRSGISTPEGPEFAPTVTSRLRTLNELCEAHGATLILLIPPTLSSQGAARQMAIASEKAGVHALMPIDPVELTARFYSDAVHLNSEGAVRFTSALANDLPKTIIHKTTASRD
jgi:hypothetical protein